MAFNTAVTERKILENLARKYEDQGCDVVVKPSPDQLPAFLQGYRPDLLALQQENNIVVEVRSRGKARRSDYWEDLTKTVQEQPGWRLHIVASPAPEAESLSEETINTLLGRGKRLITEGQMFPALLVALSASEAAMRYLRDRYRIELPDDQPATLISGLQTAGFLSAGECEQLQTLMQKRIHIAQGVRGNVDAAEVEGLYKLAVELLAR